MPAKIVVTSGPMAGREFPIRKAAVRVGRSLNCEVALDDPAVPDHALTVQFDGQGYTVFNKTNTQMVHEGRALPGNQSTRWNFGEKLGVSGSSTLRLEVVTESFDAKPNLASDWSIPQVIDDSPVEEDIFEEVSREQVAQPEKAASAKKEKNNQTLPIIVIGVCVIVAALVLVAKLKQGKTAASPVNKPVVLEELIPKLKERIDKNTKNNRNAEPELGHIYDLLLEASTSDSETAKANYRKIMDYLRPHTRIQVDGDATSNQPKTTAKGDQKSPDRKDAKSTVKNDPETTGDPSNQTSDPKTTDDKSTEMSDAKSGGETSSSKLVFTDDLYREVFEFVSPKL